MISTTPEAVCAAGYGKLFFRIGGTGGWDTVLQLVLPRRWFAQHCARKLSRRGVDSFSLPDGSMWGINRDTKKVEEIK